MTVQYYLTHEKASENADTKKREQRVLYGLGCAAALLIVLAGLLEILITFLPGGYTTADTVIDWFQLLQDHPLLGLRNLGLVNIAMTVLGVPMVLTLYFIHRKMDGPLASLAMILSLMGTAVFFATNRAFPIFELSHQYAAAATQDERAIIEAAGQAMLSIGQSHTPGTFLAFILSETAGILMAVVALRGGVFSRITAYLGIAGYGLLFLFEIFSSFVPSSHDAILMLVMGGGLLNLTWYILIARKFFCLAQSN